MKKKTTIILEPSDLWQNGLLGGFDYKGINCTCSYVRNIANVSLQFEFSKSGKIFSVHPEGYDDNGKPCRIVLLEETRVALAKFMEEVNSKSKGND